MPASPQPTAAGTTAFVPALDAGQALAADAQTDAGDARDSGADDVDPVEQTEPTEIGLAAQYMPLNTRARDNVISFAMRVVNRSESLVVPLCSLSMRYYFTNENQEMCPQSCKIDGFYSGFIPSGASVETLRQYHPTLPDRGASYIEISFPCNSVTLSQGEGIETHQQFHTEPYRDFNESDDYSFRPAPTFYTDWERVTLYYNGMLVWGRPPR